jgi:hypothetical protein
MCMCSQISTTWLAIVAEFSIHYPMIKYNIVYPQIPNSSTL